MIIELLQYGTVTAGLVLAMSVWLIRRRSMGATGSTRVSISIGLVLALAVTVAFAAWRIRPAWRPPLNEDSALTFRLAALLVPLATCLIALLFLLPSLRSAGSKRIADLTPRTLLTFVPRSALIPVIGVTATLVILSVIAGVTSESDEAGRYVLYTLQASDTSSASTTFYGWWFSLPSLSLLAVVALLALLELRSISGPPLLADRAADIASRRERSATVLIVTTGGLLLHLASVLDFLHDTSTLSLGMDAGDPGLVELGTPFAAAGPLLLVLSYVAATLGYAAWWVVLLAALPTRGRRRAAVAQS